MDGRDTTTKNKSAKNFMRIDLIFEKYSKELTPPNGFT
jgi:hypothetical protein